VGTVAADIVKNATELLGDSEVYTRMSKAANPYGDGDAASRILEGLAHVGIRNG
jgi:UDP-N-acetylglucosamine 2-epimerase (non-hydrolysing)